ncbi:hypothetical protein [Burkholderia gladioli]|uniref:hypothetical protein n=1 Tax=Burkholderia gladioli TaxID=28095 RepID=UPI00163DFAE9|nr:hypothetical protein [Burkholderia gladioli]
MEVSKSIPVDHPLYYGTLDMPNGRIIVAFTVGRRVYPTPEAKSAEKRIRAAIAKIDPADLELFRKWQGGLVIHGMLSTTHNPEITDEMVEGFRAAAAAAYPDYSIADGWKNAMHDIDGYSVSMVPRKKA